MRQPATRSNSTRRSLKPAASPASTSSQPLSIRGSSATSSGEPANADTLAYGELPGPIGFSGSICHRLWPADASQSMK